jgi:alpha-glucosidase
VFDALVRDAHDRGIRVLLDFVPNHTSDEHAWFVESMSGRDSPKRDWYIWRDPAPSGGPPNEWQSAFGGPAWRFDEASGQYVMTSFYPKQVDLNWENREVRRAVTGAMRWWIGRGVDGFRLDVVHRLSKGIEMLNGPRAHEFVREIRDALGPEVLLLGEVWLFDLSEVTRYLAPGELDLAFAFPFAFAPWDAAAIAGVISKVVERWGSAGAWPVWHIANHDMPRPATRWGSRAVRAAAVLQMTLPGAAVIYQGDELGMADGDVPPERRRDRIGRDGCRTPMRWTAVPNAGFCPDDVEPWLPVGREPPGADVATEEQEGDSILALYRRLLALRAASPALNDGDFAFAEDPTGLVRYERAHPDERLVVIVNMVDESSTLDLPAGRVVLASAIEREDELVGGLLVVRPNEALVIRPD